MKTSFDLVVLGSGPGGYAAAFRAADLGLKVAIIERHPTLGGVCLNVGCIPSKALLHIAGQIHQAEKNQFGVTFSSPHIDLEKVRAHKNNTVTKFTDNLALMAKGRNVAVFVGQGKLLSSSEVEIISASETRTLHAKHIILAVGSRAISLPFIPKDSRIWDSTDALKLDCIPKHLAVLGGGIIGLEMATVYQALGAKVTVIEQGPQLILGADKDQVRIFEKANQERMQFMLDSKLTQVTAKPEHLELAVEAKQGAQTITVDALLVAVGRRPNGFSAGIPETGIKVDEQGFVLTDSTGKTSVPNIYAIGDVTHGPMLAHKASHQGHVAAEAIAGHTTEFAPLAIPSIAYTYPEVAWVGMTESEVKAEGISYKIAKFPWSASGRAIASGYTQGATKLIYEPENNRLLGASIVGEHAGELLGELTLALEYGATLEDIALTIHAHPSLHESVGLAAELGTGTITDLPNTKR